MKRQERRGAYADGDLSDSSSAEEKCPEAEQQPVTRCQAWSSLARTTQDDQLLLEQKILRDHRAHATGATQCRSHDGQVKQGEQEVLHARDSVGQTSGATQRCLNLGFSERIGNSRRTGGEIGRIRPTKVFERAGESRMTPGARSEDPDVSYVVLRDRAFAVTGGTGVTGRRPTRRPRARGNPSARRSDRRTSLPDHAARCMARHERPAGHRRHRAVWLHRLRVAHSLPASARAVVGRVGRALRRWCVARGGGAARCAGRRCRPRGAARPAASPVRAVPDRRPTGRRPRAIPAH